MMVIAIKPVLDKYMGELLSQYNVEDVPSKSLDFGEIDFESNKLFDRPSFSKEIDFESDEPLRIPLTEFEEPESIYKGLIKPTAKALVKVPTSIALSLALLPGAGIASLIELIPTISADPSELISFGSLDDAMDTYEQIMSIPGKLITTPEERKAIENISVVMEPIRMAGEGWRLIGKAVNDGLVQLGLESTYLEPLLATYGEAAAVFGLPGVVKSLRNSTTFRMLSVKERGLVVQSLAEAKLRNPGMTEGQLLRTYDDPVWRAEALSKRSMVEDYGNLKKYAEVKSREAKVESIVKVQTEEPSRPQGVASPEDVIPSHTFTSKKGNYYYEIDGKWYDSKGKEVVNKFILRAAEAGRVSSDAEKAVVEDLATIKGIEDRYGKDIEKVSDKEVEEFFTEREVTEPEPEPETEIDWFGEGEVDIRVREALAKLERITEAEPREPVDLYRQFREEDPEITRRNLELLPKYSKIDTPDILLARISNEINGWVDGEKIDIDTTLNLLDKLAEQSKLWADRTEDPTGIFRDMTLTELQNFSDYLGKLNSWARGLRSGIERREMYIRIDEGVPDTSKPQGLYLVKKGREELIEDLKGIRYEYSFTPKSPLNVEGELMVEHARGGGMTIPASSGIKALKKLVRDDRFDKLMTMSKDELIMDLSKEFPDVDWDRFYDSYEVLEGYAGKLAREKGHDSIVGDLDEVVALDKSVLRSRVEQREGVKLYAGIPLDAAGKLINKLIGRFKREVPERPPNPFPKVKKKAREMVRERRSRLNLANYETNKFVAGIERKTTPEQREVFIFALEKTDVPKEFNRPDLQRVLNKHRKHIEAVSGEIKDWFDEGWKKIKYHIPNLSVKQIEDYVTHLWDIPKHKRAEAVAWFSTQNRLLERRFIPTYAEGIREGYMPKTLDILEVIRAHDSICNRAIENVRYVEKLVKMKEDGVPLMQRSKDAPLDWIEVDYPAVTRRIPLLKEEVGKKGEFVKGIRVRVHPDLVRPLKAMFEERFDHPIISAYEAINGIIKKTNLSISLFHHGALGETGVALIGLPKTLSIYFNPVKIYKGLVRGEFDIFMKEEIARDSILHGTQYGATADIPVAKIQRYLNDLAKVVTDVPLVNKLTKFLKDFNSVWDKALWSYLHDTLKLYGYESLVGKLDPKLDTKATEMAKREIAQFVNDTFGGQNWDTLMITPKEVQMLTWSLLSADWTWSTTRQALAPAGLGKVYKETAELRRKMGGKFWLRAALFFGVGMNMLNAMYRGKDIKENPQYYRDREYSYFDKTMFGNTVGKKTYLFKGRYRDGSERYIRWGKQFRDFFELLITPFRKLGGKMAPVPQLMSEIFTGHTLSGFKNDDIYGLKGFEKTKGIFKAIARAPLPISVKRFMKENMEFKPLDIVMQSSKGMSRYVAMEYFKKAIVEGDEDLLEDTYVGSLGNNLPAFTLFNSALSWAESEIMADIVKDIKSIEDAEDKLSAAKSAYGRRRYGRVLKRLEKEKADKEAGLRLLESASEKARLYRELGLDKKTTSFPTRQRVREPKEIKFD